MYCKSGNTADWQGLAGNGAAAGDGGKYGRSEIAS